MTILKVKFYFIIFKMLLILVELYFTNLDFFFLINTDKPKLLIITVKKNNNKPVISFRRKLTFLSLKMLF